MIGVVELTLVNVGKDTTLCDGNVSQKFVQFLIVADSQLQVTGDDTGLLIITGGIASQFEDFSRQIFKDSSQIDGSTYSYQKKAALYRYCGMTHQHQHVGRSCLSSRDGEHGRRGMRDRL